MENNYIYKDYKGDLFLFTYYNGSIMRKLYDNDKWSFEDIIISNVTSNFTFNISETDDIYIFCQDEQMNVILVKGKDDFFESQVILENNDGQKNIVYFNAIIKENILTLIYNRHCYESNNNYIYIQKFKDNTWSNPEVIDSFRSFRHKLFEFYKYRDNTFIIYQNKDKSNCLSLRKISENGFSEKNICHSTTYDIMDSSSIFANENIYLTYIIKSSFSYQLFFRKVGKGFTDPIILSEGQNIDSTLIFKTDRLYVFFMSKDIVYYVYSEDEGESFSRVKKFKDNAYSLVKAKFVSNGKFNMCLSDVYITENEPKSIKVLPDIYKNFYSDFQKPIKVINEQIAKPINNPPKKTTENNNNNTDNITEQTPIYYENLADLKNEDFYKILLEKKKAKDMEKKQNKYDEFFQKNPDDELAKLQNENEKLKKALRKFMQ